MTEPSSAGTAFPVVSTCTSLSESTARTSVIWKSGQRTLIPAFCWRRGTLPRSFVLDDVQPLEYLCNENERDRVHMVGKASDLRSVKLEPKLLAEYAGAYDYGDLDHPEIPHSYNFSAKLPGSGCELAITRSHKERSE
jgi:hypothetical protein